MKSTYGHFFGLGANSHLFWKELKPWTQNGNWTFRKRSEGVQDVFLTTYERLIYVLREECRVFYFIKQIKIDSLLNTNILLL